MSQNNDTPTFGDRVSFTIPASGELLREPQELVLRLPSVRIDQIDADHTNNNDRNPELINYNITIPPTRELRQILERFAHDASNTNDADHNNDNRNPNRITFSLAPRVMRPTAYLDSDPQIIAYERAFRWTPIIHQDLQQSVGRILRHDANQRIHDLPERSSYFNVAEFRRNHNRIVQNVLRATNFGNVIYGDMDTDNNHSSGHHLNTHDNNARHITQNKPRIYFTNYRNLNFDIKNGTWQEFFNMISENRDCAFHFYAVNGDNMAYGIGATKQVYQKICQNLINTGIVHINGYFMDINPDHDFWNDDTNIELLVIFIALMINAGCLLPYHMHPIILESIINREMSITEMEFFMRNIDPELVKNINKMSVQDAYEMGYDESDIAKIYREKLTRHLNPELNILYKKFAKHFEMFDAFNKYEIILVDEFFSGIYQITANHILNITRVADSEYEDVWKNFVNGLCESELRQMLLYFGNSLSLNNSYTIYVSDSMKTDVHITTCAGIVTINKNIITNIEQLKIIFCDGNTLLDTISDGINSNLTNQPPAISDDHDSAMALNAVPGHQVMGALLDVIANSSTIGAQHDSNPIDNSLYGRTGVPSYDNAAVTSASRNNFPMNSMHPVGMPAIIRNSIMARRIHEPPRGFIGIIPFNERPESPRVGIARQLVPLIPQNEVMIDRSPNLNPSLLHASGVHWGPGIWNISNIAQVRARGIRATINNDDSWLAPVQMPLVRNPVIIILDDETAKKKKSKKSAVRKINNTINYYPRKNHHKKSYR